jgi:hypothetical protein
MRRPWHHVPGITAADPVRVTHITGSATHSPRLADPRGPRYRCGTRPEPASGSGPDKALRARTMLLSGGPLLLPFTSLELFSPEVLATAGILLALILGALIWLRSRRHALGILLGDLGRRSQGVTILSRGLFIPANEFFSRVPEDLRNPTAGLTVHKWAGVPEVHSAAEMRAYADIATLLLGQRRRLTLTLSAGDPARQSWSDSAIVLGPHFKGEQILDACEPKLVTYRNPNAFRSVNSPEIFEAREGMDYGLIYKGRHPASHRDFWVIRGLADLGTEGAARFLLQHGADLARITGRGGFACLVAVDRAKGPARARLHWLGPKPSWWRRLLHRHTLDDLGRGRVDRGG